MNIVQEKTEKHQLWQKIMDSSTAMENLAQKNDWTGLATLLDQRQTLLNQFFNDEVAGLHRQELDKIREDIALIQHRDGELLQNGKDNRDFIAESLSRITRGKRMNKSYQSFN